MELAARLAAIGSPVKLASGYFDPLIAEHAERLGRLRDGGGALMVMVATPPEPLLSARARAELVAALAVVDYVVLPGEGAHAEWMERIQARGKFRHEAADAQLREELIRHVHTRQHSG